MALWKLFTCT